MSAIEGHTSIATRPEHLRRPPREGRSPARHGSRARDRTFLLAHRRALVAVSVLVLMTCAAVALISLDSHPFRSTKGHAPLTSRGLLSLPSALQGPASQTIGAQDPAYRAVARAGGLRLDNPAQRLSAAFAASGVTVSSGHLGLGLTLTRAGYGASPGSVRVGTPEARANRVTYNHGWLAEWYVNGPVGLEQGFTIPHAPGAAGRGQLQLVLSVSGGARATKLGGQRGIRFSGQDGSLLYGAPTAVDARGHSLPSWLQMQGQQLVLRVDTRHAAYPVRIDPFIQQGSKLTAGEINAGVFGGAVAISGDGKTALVGAPNDSPHNVFREGAVWVFTRSGESWTQQGEPLTGGEGEAGYFGASVALSADGDTALIGAPGGGSREEPAYVFTRSGSKWSLQASVKGSSETSTSNFGSSVSLSESGDTAIVGASGEKVGAQANAGAVYAFTRSAEKWSQQGERLTGSGENGAGALGESSALSAGGNTAVIGAPGNLENKGAIWTFDRSGGVWKQVGSKFEPKGEIGTGRFGASVTFGLEAGETEGRSLIGAPGDNGKLGAVWLLGYEGKGSWFEEEKFTGTGESGKAEFGARVAFTFNGLESMALVGGGADNGSVGAAWALYNENPEVSWTQKKLTAGSEELGAGGYGGAVAISADGNTGLIAAPTDDSAHSGLGAVWAYSRSGPTTWTQQGEKLTGMAELGAGEFGINTVISADGRTALVGARLSNEHHGAAWVFVRSGAEWVHQAKLTGGTEEVGAAEFGKALALSADGNTAMIGGALDEGQPKEPFSQQGAAWVFTRSGGKWKQQGKKLLDPKPEGHLFGNSVALSGDGNTAVICTYENEPHDYVFKRSGETWEAEYTIARPASEPTASFGETARISSDGQTIVISGYQDDEERGGAWVFVKRNGVWTQQGPKLTGAGERHEDFGFGGVALSDDGSTLLVGAPGAVPSGAPKENHTGVAYVFTRTGESWAPQGGELVGSGVEPFVSSFGTGVALSGDGNTALIGGGVHEAKGALWEFKRSEATWRQVGERVVASGQEGEAGFGNNLGLSADGTTALVAGPEDASKLGAVWVFMESPSLASASAAEVTETAAKLKATVNPQGEEVTECKFEYGTSTSYGSTSLCSPSPGSGTSPAAVSASIGGLAPDTVYHFRLSSSNGHGVQQTEDQTFTTLATVATAKTEAPSTPAKAETKGGGLSVQGSGGTGAVTIGSYGENIGGGSLPGAKGTYFQVYHSEGSSFTKIQYKDCELEGARALWWYNQETGWEPIPSSMAVYTETPTPCVTVTATEGTTPSIRQLSDPRHVGGVAMSAELGKCVSAKKGGYGAGCTATATSSKGKSTGSNEWYAAPAPPCYPLKHGDWGTLTPSGECSERDVSEKKGKTKGLGGYESTAGSASSGASSFSSKDEGEITLKQTTGEKETVLHCTGSHGSGAESSSRWSEEQITYEGCAHQSTPCETERNPQVRQEPGTIVSEQLEDYISKTYVVEGKEEEAGEYLDVLEGKEARAPAANQARIGPFMKFKCGSTSYEITGAVEGPLQSFKADTMTGALTATFAGGNTGAQDLFVKEGTKTREPVVMSASATTTYPGGIDVGTVPAQPQKTVIELLQSTGKKPEDVTVEVKVGEPVNYQVTVRNISPFERVFKEFEIPGCENVLPTGEPKVPPGKSVVYTCTRKFTEKGKELGTVAKITGDHGFGTKISNEELANVS